MTWAALSAEIRAEFSVLSARSTDVLVEVALRREKRRQQSREWYRANRAYCLADKRRYWVKVRAKRIAARAGHQCPVCKVEFLPLRANGVFCGNRCKNAARYTRSRA